MKVLVGNVPHMNTSNEGISRPLSGRLVDLLLIAFIVVGIGFRFSWTNWSQGADLHPDEYGLTGTLTQLRIPSSLSDYFNTRLSPISPYQKYDINGQPTRPGPDNRLRWGQWPIIIIRWVAEVTGNSGYGEMRLMGRRLSALADSLALLIIFLIGRRLYNPRTGLLAAALSALAVMQIQQSHFMTVDNFGTLFTTLAMYATIRVAQRSPGSTETRAVKGSEPAPSPGEPGTGRPPAWIWYILFGVAFGMAVASRINLLPLGGIILLAALVGMSDEPAGIRNARGKQVVRVGFYVALAFITAGLTFRVTQPMSFRAPTGDTTFFTLHPNPEWVESMKVARNESRGIGAGPPGEQWTNRPTIIFPLVNMVVWGMGLPLGLMAWAGLLWATWRTLHFRHSWKAHLLPLVWVGGYFVFMGTRHVMSVRYFLPIYPFLCLFAAWALMELWESRHSTNPSMRDPAVARHSSRSTPPVRSLTSLVLAGVVLLGTFTWAWAFVNAVYRQDNTRVRASRWMFQNIPAPFSLNIDTPAGPYTEPIPAPDGLQITAGAPYVVSFTSPVSGTLQRVDMAFVRSLARNQAPAPLRITISADAEGKHPLTQTTIQVEPAHNDPRGQPSTGSFDGASIDRKQTCYLIASVQEGKPVEVMHTIVSNESWDEALPVRIDGRDPFGQFYKGLTMEVRWPDDEHKRQMFMSNLAQVDYIILPSQRAIWSISRLPQTYPMTMEYYRALFDGRLGFDLVAKFTAPLKVGPLYISDVGGTVGWKKPPQLPLFNNNLLAAEEAFSVYDHAPVWIFKKRADFNAETARAILESVH